MLRQKPGEEEVVLVDVGQASEKPGWISQSIGRLRSALRWRWFLHYYEKLLEFLQERLAFLFQARSFLLAVTVAFSASIGLLIGGQPTLALLPALVGFGLSLAGLLYGGFPQGRALVEENPWYVGLAAWALVTTLFAFVGFSSTAVVFVVLFIGGFTMANVLWGLVPRILSYLNPLQGKGGGDVTEAASSPVPLLLTFAVIATWSLMGSLIMGYTRLYENRPWGAAFLGMQIALLLGTIPLLYQMIQEVRKPTIARWHLLRPQRLLRDVIFAMSIGALVGYEVNLASTGSLLAGIPAFALVLVLLSYLGVLIRQPFSFGARLRPYHPLVLPAFGALLLFAPTVVLLSNPPAALTRLYGAAQAAGLLLGTLFIVTKGTWMEHAHRIRVQLRDAVKEKIPVNLSKEQEGHSYIRIERSGSASKPSGIRVKEVSVPEEKGG